MKVKKKPDGSPATMPFGLYIHVPWCSRRCPYCDFYLVVGRPAKNFLDGIRAEWQERQFLWQSTPSSSLYFGGGTPSLLDPKAVGSLLEDLKGFGALLEDAEITLEANPEDISADFANNLKGTAVNRISLGMQSFDDAALQMLGRRHTAREGYEAIDNLLAAGFTNISIDLIIGLPGQRSDTVLTAIDHLIELKIPHLSTYLLTIEDGTAFYRRIASGRMEGPNDDDQAAIYREIQEKLTGHGFVQYDISSYALSGAFSRHNQIYWAQGSFLGLGPGAHSMRLNDDGSIERAQNKTDLITWLRSGNSERGIAIDRLEPAKALLESLAFGLRNMASGIDIEELSIRHRSSPPEGLSGVINKYKEYKWLEGIDDRIRITAEGALFADAIMREILSC